MIKGQDPSHIVFGNSLTRTDGYPGDKFDYLLANPPFGVDWKKYAADIQTEHTQQGFDGRYGPGLPRVSDGSLLFLLHMLSKFKPVADDPATPDIIEGGSRMAIVFSGSPLFSGAAGGGESEIRRYVIENDLLEGIVALPDQLFYNTGISTYFWVLTNRKTPDRVGKIALIDARESYVKMRKSLGDKRKMISTEQIADITRLYDDAIELAATGADKRVKVFDREAFGFQRVTVEQPLRPVWRPSIQAIESVLATKRWRTWLSTPDNDLIKRNSPESPGQELAGVTGWCDEDHSFATEEECFWFYAGDGLPSGWGLPTKLLMALAKASAIADPTAPIITNRKGHPEPDPELRDQENIPLPDGYLWFPDDKREEMLRQQAERYLIGEIHPYLPDAWIDHTKTKIGYEIPFTRHFYEYTPPRPVAEIDAELQEIEKEIQQLLGGLAR